MPGSTWMLRAVAAVLPDGIAGPVDIVVDDDRIASVRAPGRGPADVELASGLLTPGFVDLQVNGCFGWDFATDGARGVRAAAERLPATGVTAFLPTFITAPVAQLEASVRAIAPLLDGRPGAPGGARVLGAHAEGPFISPAHKGAHPPAHIVDPAPAAVERLTALPRGALRIVTLAPERPGGVAAVQAFSDAGAIVSIGHSDATAAEVQAAADAGATMVTHLYNGQRGLHHREPGVVGAALTDDRLTLGLIADLEHVAAPALRLAFRAAAGRVALVTDAISAAGMPPGRHVLGGREVDVAPGRAPRHAQGGLAGAALTLDVAVANLARLGVSRADAIRAATQVPADAVGAAGLGRIAPGATADMVWLDDGLRVQATWIAGRQTFADAV